MQAAAAAAGRPPHVLSGPAVGAGVQGGGGEDGRVRHRHPVRPPACEEHQVHSPPGAACLVRNKGLGGGGPGGQFRHRQQIRPSAKEIHQVLSPLLVLHGLSGTSVLGGWGRDRDVDTTIWSYFWHMKYIKCCMAWEVDLLSGPDVAMLVIIYLAETAVRACYMLGVHAPLQPELCLACRYTATATGNRRLCALTAMRRQGCACACTCRSLLGRTQTMQPAGSARTGRTSRRWRMGWGTEPLWLASLGASIPAALALPPRWSSTPSGYSPTTRWGQRWASHLLAGCC